MMKGWGKRIAPFMMAALFVISAAATARADLWDTSRNETVKQNSVSRGKIGRSMNIPVTIYNYSGETWEDVYVKVENSDASYGYMPSPDNADGWQVYPFEMSAGRSVAGGICAKACPMDILEVQE